MEENTKGLDAGGKFEFPIIQEQAGCGCGGDNAADADDSGSSLDQPFVSGSLSTPAGLLPKVSSRLTRQDRWGTIKARFGVGRMNYAVHPGLYALGEPDENAPVLVTANYKMSFDCLRQALPGRNAWILVLDTKGINVWCAAGKGTFGTNELVYRIEASGLKKVVSHRKIVLPQLGAPGVAAHQVKKFSGFKVHYGPVRARDIPAYLDNGFTASKEMRIVTFPLADRAVLIPIELQGAAKPFALLSLALLVLAGILGRSGFQTNLLHDGLFAVVALFAAIFGGAVLTPLLLPWLPGRAFSVKGLSIGLVTALGLMTARGVDVGAWAGRVEILAWLLIIPAIAAYLAMNFTGASTYTSLSGVKKEMRFALPLEITAGIVGLMVWITSLILRWE
ncbi:MAG TPA: mercury methylation corrinoid protein HgcA [Smithellaceae bacterium]|nr:mercury methylation corrinoid protein HgcA [Smithellaceae bacterium]